MTDQSKIEKAIPVGFWFGLSENRKREILSRHGFDVDRLSEDDIDKVFLKEWGIEDDDWTGDGGRE